jgi:predicted esterase
MLSFALLAAAGVSGQVATPEPGQVVERLQSSTDSTQSYALYLPTRLPAVGRLPALLLMDPRGRALVPLGLVRESAERLGYIVISSYNSASDTDQPVNIPAVNAMIAELQGRRILDERRIYLVGFSGTARDGWLFAQQLRGHVAGLIGVGAGLSAGMRLAPPAAGDSSSFVFFGSAGTTDFNFDEMRGLDRHLDSIGIPHRVRYFEGPHSWPPAGVMTEAVEWMELQAMRRRLIPPREGWVDSLFRREVAVAESLEAAGDPFEAWRRYSAVAVDYPGLLDVTAASQHAVRLARDKRVRQTADRYREVDRIYARYLSRVGEFLLKVQSGERLPTVKDGLRQLEVEKLRRQAADSGDAIGRGVAIRQLEQAFIAVAFYEPRGYLARGEAAKALALLELAEAIRPGRSSVCTARQRALRMLGREAEVGALSCGG